ncbi:MYND domain protein, putative [Talaromyces stipitatus ATCC 10500]|uniref:MYND domain protein, putative n=1 Tax=Talaromyces stipitatus (strain ATCC 10500 / CBS 375.48 / QM 6759 / NRRL 1006) TaxID=441959 RepID=B8MEJ0_TALSN|nr:MYND domain protein, putative [Talaromyces stipitatus ATCC 10500]EED16617.1 MYND domain protein, putative [Talaromyces stipitatus ATCC 10500]
MASKNSIKFDITEICAGCKKSSTSLSQPLKCCARCKETLYCSRECQTADWKTHKKSCNKAPRPSLSGNMIDSERSGLDDFTYYNTVAHTIPGARELAKTLNISLPTGDNCREGMA